jgi:site-specific recombinase XerD
MDAASLGRHVQTFFGEYLLAQRNVSPHTILAYRDTLKLFFAFAAKRQKKSITLLCMDDLHIDAVLAFLEHLERERQNTIATRNARLAAVRVFFRHIATRAPEELDLCRRIEGIPAKRAPKPEVHYLERDEMDALLKGVDRTTFDGRRDYALLAFAYQTGVRAHELVTLKACDLELGTPASARIWGKGRKERIVPLWRKTAALLREWLCERQVDTRASVPVFVNHRGGPLTRWGVRYILKRHARAAAKACPSIEMKRIHPHVLRHTAAVHMLQAGVDPSGIRDILGHANAETTWRYARINLEAKRKAIETCARQGPKITRAKVPIWRRDTNLLTQLEAIGKGGELW